MRIIGGRNKGTSLASVGTGDTAAHLRPTTDRVRESIFNLLINGGYSDPISDARVLDIFAGTGALGLEALSRGAQFAMFIDDGAKSQKLIKQNIETIRVSGKTKLVRRNAVRLGQTTEAPFDLIFLDPPYGKKLGEKSLLSGYDGGWFAPDCLIVWEENKEQSAPQNFRMLDARRYGDTWVHILCLDTL